MFIEKTTNQAREISPVPDLLFRELDYNLIDAVCVFALCY